MTDRSPPQRLSPGRIEQALADFPDWRQRDGAFVRSYRFADFRQAMRFVADVAEARQHHPDWPMPAPTTRSSSW
jgi:pterin-4a-carbinolamine dehydratase